jgi:hypothetical protein
MPGSSTTPSQPGARDDAPGHIAFHYLNSVGTRDHLTIAAQWLACAYPCQRFVTHLTTRHA